MCDPYAEDANEIGRAATIRTQAAEMERVREAAAPLLAIIDKWAPSSPNGPHPEIMVTVEMKHLLALRDALRIAKADRPEGTNV